MTTRRFETGICCFSMRMSSVCHQEIMQSLITFLDIRTSTFLSILYQSYCPFKNLSYLEYEQSVLFLAGQAKVARVKKTTRVTEGCRPRFAPYRSTLTRAYTSLTESEEKRDCSQPIHYLIDTTLNTISLYTFQAIRR